ncbi:MAG: hypothetical protein PPP56_11655 [Longimonas sp.]|uniref:hypothetical protein n=1 Tax=Longimonas sp. TaxID=2039626 RepID=UPI0033594A3D
MRDRSAPTVTVDYSMMQYAFDIASFSDTYIRVPHKNELGLGFSLVRRFVRTHMPDEMSRVSDMFRSRGAYRRYKQLLAEKEMLNDWHQFEEEHMKRALRRWCELEGIALREDDS